MIVADAELFKTVVAPLARKPGIEPLDNGLLPCDVAPGTEVSNPMCAPAFSEGNVGAVELSMTRYSPLGSPVLT